ncbi:MAG TPA: hypothetical protein VHQ21_05540, partial [Rhodanobacteraceae bacterium]|nr:hypothetical protein [Rhodanobacteraceae bacterium]
TRREQKSYQVSARRSVVVDARISSRAFGDTRRVADAPCRYFRFAFFVFFVFFVVRSFSSSQTLARRRKAPK